MTRKGSYERVKRIDPGLTDFMTQLSQATGKLAAVEVTLPNSNVILQSGTFEKPIRNTQSWRY